MTDKTLIWDFNGTSIDDLDLCLGIENLMLKERNMKYPYTVEQYRDLFCFPVVNYYERIGYTFKNETYDQISKEFAARYSAGFASCHLMDGFLDKIQEAKQKGYKNIILSVSEKRMLIKQCTELGILDYFDEILGTDTIHAVSKLAVARQWMKTSGNKAQDCICIGDTTHDAETADALGCDCILIACGHMSKERLMAVNGHVVDSIAEIII